MEERSPGHAPTQLLQQQRVTAIYREMQQAAYELKLAEQDVLNAQDAYSAAQARADTLKAELEKAAKARDAARAVFWNSAVVARAFVSSVIPSGCTSPCKMSPP